MTAASAQTRGIWILRGKIMVTDMTENMIEMMAA
jgi:hypothetical protein